MSVRRIVAMLAAAAFVAAAAAIEPPPAAPASEEPAPAAGEESSDAGEPAPAPAPAPAAEEKGDDETLPPLPPDTAPVGPPPQRFNPTEKVRADFPVSFPIDI